MSLSRTPVRGKMDLPHKAATRAMSGDTNARLTPVLTVPGQALLIMLA